MSYSLSQKCWKCMKKDKCMDGNIIVAAVSIIHSLGQDKGHLGGGSIEHNCTYGYEERPSPDREGPTRSGLRPATARREA